MNLRLSVVIVILSFSGAASSADKPVEQLKPSLDTSKRCSALASNDRMAALMRDNGQSFDLAMNRVNMIRNKEEREAGKVAISNAYIAHPEIPAPHFYDFSYRLCLNANLEIDHKEQNEVSNEEASYRVERGTPVQADQIVGTWTCRGSSGTTYPIAFNADNTYLLKKSNGSQSRGTYSIEGNILSRKDSQASAIDVATTPIAVTEDGSLYFVNISDPNLTESCQATTTAK